MVLTGRGRAGASSLGVRGRAVQQSQNLRVVQCKPSRVAIECLSSKTTELQLQNILTSVGPIQISYPQRKAIATFCNPAHAALFQQQYHRHMVDLTYVNVTLVED
uniref:RRM domain-containing protein n=1 Tax=Eptatretus burgeri TaxID=7764 RepID=A0A8C4R142_EPTBU